MSHLPFRPRSHRVEVINLCPHAVDLILPDGAPRTLPSSGRVARLAAIGRPLGQIDGIPAVLIAEQQVVGLPRAADGVVYVCSTVLAREAALRGRSDVFAPDAGASAIRDRQGRLVAVRGLRSFAGPAISATTDPREEGEFA